MKIEIITLFPDYFDSVISQSIIGKGRDKKLFEIDIVNLRDFAEDRHKTADDKPFGGGGGMVLKIEPLYKCLKSLGCGNTTADDEKIILTSAAGKTLTQDKAVECSLLKRLTVICGHYLGVDERLLSLFEIDEVSIGDYVLTGGEPAAAVMLDGIVRLIPGVLGNFESALSDSHTEKILGPPVYTRPEDFEGRRVPDELLTGNHAEIERFRKLEALKKTFENRPELLEKVELDSNERKYIDDLKKRSKDK
jgi:tRNA (guanine37-N1)-methyltransferase